MNWLRILYVSFREINLIFYKANFCIFMFPVKMFSRNTTFTKDTKGKENIDPFFIKKLSRNKSSHFTTLSNTQPEADAVPSVCQHIRLILYPGQFHCCNMLTDISYITSLVWELTKKILQRDYFHSRCWIKNLKVQSTWSYSYIFQRNDAEQVWLYKEWNKVIRLKLE